MKVKLNIRILIIIFFTLLFLPIVQSLNLSTIQKNQYSQVRIGESTEFTVLFWNTENYSFPIALSLKQASENLTVLIRPDNFMIEPSLVTKFPAAANKEYVNTPQGLMVATPVKITVKPSNSATLGIYDIYVKAIVRSPETGITPLLEKTFKFTVNVTSAPTLSERLSQVTKGVTETVKDASSRITGMLPAGFSTNWIFVVIFIIVLAFVIALIWLKFYRKKSNN